MSQESPSQITRLLNEVGQGETAPDELLALVYDQLHVIASARMRSERSDHTLQPTALVHEAYVKLSDRADPQYRDRTHFLATAARVMRQILIDHARHHGAAKRGGVKNLTAADRALAQREDLNLDDLF